MGPADPNTSASAPPVTVTARHLLMLASIAAAWGASFLFIRIAAPALGPTRLIEVRMAVAGLVLLGYALATRRRPSLEGRSWQWLVIGALWALPFVLIAVAELHLTASLAAVLNATTPLFAALVAAVWLRDRLTAAKSAGLLLGLLGVLVVVGWSPLALSRPVVWSAGASLLAAAVYGIAGAYGARAFQGMASLRVATGQLLAGALLLLPTVLISIPPRTDRPVTGTVVLAATGLALPCTAWAFVLFFRLVAELGPTSALTVTFLVPVFGILWGAIFLGERVSWSLVGGLAVVLAGVTLVTGWRPHHRRTRSSRLRPCTASGVSAVRLQRPEVGRSARPERVGRSTRSSSGETGVPTQTRNTSLVSRLPSDRFRAPLTHTGNGSLTKRRHRHL